MPVLLSGITGGKNWFVDVVPSAFGGYIACIQVGTTFKTTPDRYEQKEEAKQAGCDLLAETFDELELEVCNA